MRESGADDGATAPGRHDPFERTSGNARQPNGDHVVDIPTQSSSGQGPRESLLANAELELLDDDAIARYMNTLRTKRHDDLEAALGHKHFIERSNWLRAAVLGANDGLVSVSSLAIGVAGASTSQKTILLTGVAALVAGALSMAAGEFVSVSAQKEIEMAEVEKERLEQKKGPDARAREFEEFCQIYVDRGLTPGLARQVAVQMYQHDVIRAHARDELGIDVDDYTNPWSAALASALAFAGGAIVPIIATLIPAANILQRVIIVVAFVTAALVASGFMGAVAGGTPILRGTFRVVVGGWLAMAVTFGVGQLFGTSVHG